MPNNDMRHVADMPLFGFRYFALMSGPGSGGRWAAELRIRARSRQCNDVWLSVCRPRTFVLFYCHVNFTAEADHGHRVLLMRGPRNLMPISLLATLDGIQPKTPIASTAWALAHVRGYDFAFGQRPLPSVPRHRVLTR